MRFVFLDVFLVNHFLLKAFCQCHLEICLSPDGGVFGQKGGASRGRISTRSSVLVGQLVIETGSAQAALTTLCSGSPGDLSKKKNLATPIFHSTDLSAAHERPIGDCSLGTSLHRTSVGTLHAWGTLGALPLLFSGK